MRRRLDLAATLVAAPEPSSSSTSRRPASTRAPATSCGTCSTRLVGEGATILLTTQYLEEADRLAQEIVVVDHGRVIARGDARTLKRQVGGDQLAARDRAPADLGARRRAARARTSGSRWPSTAPTRRATAPTRATAWPRRRRLAEALADDELAVEDLGAPPADARRRLPHPHGRADRVADRRRPRQPSRKERRDERHHAPRADIGTPESRRPSASRTSGSSPGAGSGTCAATRRRWPTRRSSP